GTNRIESPSGCLPFTTNLPRMSLNAMASLLQSDEARGGASRKWGRGFEKVSIDRGGGLVRWRSGASKGPDALPVTRRGGFLAAISLASRLEPAPGVARVRGRIMTNAASYHEAPKPMRIQARRGSLAEKRYYAHSALPEPWRMPKAIANGVSPRPLEDLIFHGGKIVPQMRFQNIYCGSGADWQSSDIEKIDTAITAAMRDKRLNNVMRQYFDGTTLSCDPLESLKLADAKPKLFDEPDVQAKIVTLFRSAQIRDSDLDAIIFNLLLPRGTVLALGDSNSLNGLGGYHGSVHVQHDGRQVTLYYSANVFSDRDNGIPVFDQPWKNVVGTLYHELN